MGRCWEREPVLSRRAIKMAWWGLSGYKMSKYICVKNMDKTFLLLRWEVVYNKERKKKKETQVRREGIRKTKIIWESKGENCRLEKLKIYRSRNYRNVDWVIFKEDD